MCCFVKTNHMKRTQEQMQVTIKEWEESGLAELVQGP